jgi:arsenate reductase
MLGLSARELMRTKEDIYKELDLANENDEEKLIEAMAKNPKLIERPIIIKGNKAIIGRPTERIAEFLNS